MLSPPVLELAERAAAPRSRRRWRASIFLSTGGEAIEAAVRMAKLYTGGFEVASLTRSWHGLTGGAAALTLAGGRRGYGPPMPGGFALPAPYAYRCPIKHCDGDLRLLVPGGRASTSSTRRRSARPRRSWPSRSCRRAA